MIKEMSNKKKGKAEVRCRKVPKKNDEENLKIRHDVCENMEWYFFLGLERRKRKEMMEE